MGRYTGPDCRLCRREGMKLFLKGTRCMTPKCAIETRNSPPGQAVSRFRPRKASPYSQQVREKQKLRRFFRVSESQFRMYFKRASHMRGITGDNLVHLLESRLDNVIYRMGFALSRSQAREMVSHGHFLVNGKKVNIPSYLVKVNDLISIKEKSRKFDTFQESMKLSANMGLSPWLERTDADFSGRLIRMPSVDEVGIPVELHLIVEYYSR